MCNFFFSGRVILPPNLNWRLVYEPVRPDPVSGAVAVVKPHPVEVPAGELVQSVKKTVRNTVKL